MCKLQSRNKGMEASEIEMPCSAEFFFKSMAVLGCCIQAQECNVLPPEQDST